jgi:molybdate transport system substrate-binding protein
VIALLLVALSVAGATRPAELPAQEADEPELLVLAPASMADVIPEIAEAWLRRGGGPVRLGVDATSRLAPQVVAGAPADVFISADLAWMEWTRDRGGIRDPVLEIAGNHLVLIVPAGADPILSAPADVTDPRYTRIALAGENVPAGRYARSALEALGLWESVAGRVVRGGSVRGALEWVARGEADAGVVYATDARAEPRVRAALEKQFGAVLRS